jgi:hypothetical protein
MTEHISAHDGPRPLIACLITLVVLGLTALFWGNLDTLISALGLGAYDLPARIVLLFVALSLAERAWTTLVPRLFPTLSA